MKTVKDYLFTCLILIILLIIVGCSKTVYVPVESVRMEYRDRVVSNDRIIHDSIYIRERSDTIFIEKFKTIIHDQVKIDSIVRCDTIRVPYPVEKIVYRNKIKWYQELLIYIGLLSVGVVFAWLIKNRLLM